MRKPSFRRMVFGTVLLLVSCGGGGGQSGTAGSGGSGQAGSGGGGRAGSTGGGGGGGGASCVPSSACGGDFVGTWRATRSCFTTTKDLSSVCPGANTEIDFAIGGTLTFNTDGSYSSMPTAGAATYHEHFPAGCMPFGQTCEELWQTLVDAGTGTTGTCSTDTAGACNCEVMGPETVTNETGTFTISSGALTLTHGGMTSMALYCVQGGLLYVMPEPSDGGMTWKGGVIYARP